MRINEWTILVHPRIPTCLLMVQVAKLSVFGLKTEKIPKSQRNEDDYLSVTFFGTITVFVHIL